MVAEVEIIEEVVILKAEMVDIEEGVVEVTGATITIDLARFVVELDILLLGATTGLIGTFKVQLLAIQTLMGTIFYKFMVVFRAIIKDQIPLTEGHGQSNNQGHFVFTNFNPQAHYNQTSTYIASPKSVINPS
ncbi:hypothetical protein Ddye_029695 [Dipteronia dyeriana]|uniref:Uncharacterized protein n=1 Tax=Dipteronia dyeriana TaxID=168575 RepID=A0AAD9TFL7_9ROSI|nr:hypothetical protein Ddye_029695 [Dipteronia dyeriana]